MGSKIYSDCSPEDFINLLEKDEKKVESIEGDLPRLYSYLDS